MSYTYCQERNFEILGKDLAKAIIKNDSVSFYSLILPKEAIIEKFKTEAEVKLEKEEIDSGIKNINENYTNIISSTYGLSFFSLNAKTTIFKLDLLKANFKIVDSEETKIDTNIFAIQGEIEHKKFTHFTFYASEFKGKLYLASHLINISEVNKFDERATLKKVKLSTDHNGNLIAQGKIELDSINTPKKNILNCILNSPTTVGVKENSKHKNISNDFEYIKSQWRYPYYINNSSDFAGMVEFKYEFKITDGTIYYNYYDFKHDKDDSTFRSIGILPFKVNETVLEVFSEKEYQEIIEEIYLNQVLTIKRIKQFSNNCFK
ncbi:hypothetical protein C7H52_10850 [Aurantibacter aestuarii]|uniref:Uncharacterized protein n=2 Tax=Aurantibacter aestuarii TaxID=1266046 RepID=A0A2T1N719_9FLAO|nr:hypothetical protein C7H52_10850 [Aurantibacter aestuarii]